MPRRLRLLIVLVASYALVASLAATLFAASPKVTCFFPAGGQRGQTVDVTVSGDFSTWPVKVWSDQPGVVVSALEDKGKLRVAIAADVLPGAGWLRVHDAAGASSPWAWIVGQLPEEAETEPNNTPAEARPVSLPLTVNGRLGQGGDVDGFIVELKRGQTLVASVTANNLLGSPLDGVLQVCEMVERPASAGSPKRIEAFVIEQNHDAVGVDPQVVFTALRDGRYLVRLMAFSAPGSSSIAFAGGEALVYRLQLTASGMVDHAFPLALGAGASEVRLFGWGLDPQGVATTVIDPPANEPFTSPDRKLLRAFLPGIAGDVTLPRVIGPSILAAENARPASPQPVEAPILISGRLTQPRQIDAFRFHAAKDEKYVLRLESRALGFPLDGVLLITDGDGNLLARGDDTESQRDPTVLFTAPADGDFIAQVRDLHGRGGLRFVYRLSLERQQPDFALALAQDAFVFAPGKPLEIPVSVERRFGLGEPITIRAVGLPTGIEAPAVVSEPTGDSAKLVKLVLTSAAAPALQGLAIRIEGQLGNSAPRTALFSLKHPLAGQHSALWLTVAASESK